MDGHLQRGEHTYRRGPDGAWLQLDRATGTWVSSAPPPPPPPPPPLPATGSPVPAPAYPAPAAAPKVATPAAIVALVLATAIAGGSVWYRVSEVVPTAPAPPAGAPVAVPGSPAPATETTIYEIAPLLATRCIAGASEQSRAQAPAALPERFDPKLRELAAEVAALRGVSFRRPVRTVLTTPAKIGSLATSEVRSSRRLRIEQSVLKTLGAIPRDIDLLAEVKRSIGADIAGFYRPDKKTIYAPRLRSADDPLNEITLVHELEHALMDQHTGLPLDEKVPALASDRALAARALIEGDASLVTQDYIFFGLDPEGRIELGTDPAMHAPASSELPYLVQRSFSFPYNEGLLFACYLYDKGGWPAVDAAYRDPPRSTAEILFPGRYGTGPGPRDVPDPRPEGSWDKTLRISVGASDLLWLLTAPNGRPSGLPDPGRVSAWGGGEIHVFERRGERGFVMSLAQRGVVDGAPSPGVLCDEIAAWLEDSWGAPSSTGPVDRWEQRGSGRIAMRCHGFGPRVAFAGSRGAVLELLGGARP